MQDNDPDDEIEFTGEELRAALRDVGQHARDMAFAAGRPVFVMRGKSIVAVYKDGTEEVIESLSPEIDIPVPVDHK